MKQKRFKSIFTEIKLSFICYFNVIIGLKWLFKNGVKCERPWIPASVPVLLLFHLTALLKAALLKRRLQKRHQLHEVRRYAIITL